MAKRRQWSQRDWDYATSIFKRLNARYRALRLDLPARNELHIKALQTEFEALETGRDLKDLGNAAKQEVGRWANNQVENGHLPFRRRERAMLRFRQMRTLKKFASVHANVHNHFRLERHLVDRQTYKERRSAALVKWGSLAS